MKRKNKRFQYLASDWFMLRLIWKFTPGLLIGELIFGLLLGINNSVQVLFINVFYNCIDNGKSFMSALTVILGMIAFIFCYQIVKQYYFNVIRPSKQQILQYKMHTKLFEISKNIEISNYDDAEFYDNFIWSISQSDTRAIALLDVLSSIITSVTGISVMVSLFFSISPVLSLVAVIASILSLLIQKASVKILSQKALACNSKNRKISYYEKIYSLSDTAKEVRISHVDEIIQDKYKETLQEIRQIEEKYYKKNIFCTIAGKILASAVEPFIYIVLLYQIMITKSVSIAGLAVALSSFWALKWSLQSVVDKLAELSEQGIYIEKVRTFMEYKPSLLTGTRKTEAFQSLTLQNVSFQYSTGKTALSHINLTINQGEKIAFVGYNGAGKTTLTKLLLRLYDPTEGRILYNNSNIKQYELKSYQSNFGVVFQDFRIFAASIAENVLCDNYDEKDEGVVLKALELCTFTDKLKVLPDGIKTKLTKEFYDDGINISGGESQKIAIARMFSSPFNIIIMDEPSSAMDPVAEHKINQNINDFAGDKTVITISHRLSTTRHADKIYFLENGEIVESGTHDELMNVNGKYAEMFHVQAKKYQNSNQSTAMSTGRL